MSGELPVLKRSFVLSFLVAPLVIFTVTWSVYINKSFRGLTKYVNLSAVFEVQRGGRDGRRFTLTRRTSGDVVAKVYRVHHVPTVIADSSLALSIDIDTLRMMTHYTLPRRMIAQTMCVLFFASVEHR